MTVFKTFWKIVNKYKGLIIMYTMILIIFAGVNMTTSDNNMDFSNSKADVYIVNKDENRGYTKNLINYIESKNNVIELEEDDNSLNDALFYRKINYLIIIPKNYNKDIINNKKPILDIKSTGDYNASLIEMQLKRYLKVQEIYKSDNINRSIEKINKALEKETKVEKKSKLDNSIIAREAFFFNFSSYTILAIVIFVICIVLASFHQETINKRTIISSMNYRKHNLIILGASSIFAIIADVVLILIGFIFIGKSLFSIRGLLYIGNLFVFTFVALTLALIISNLTNNKNAISGIVNVVALGSSFLCGAFVPISFLPEWVVSIAHVIPTYWFIKSNELIKHIEVLNIGLLKPILNNMIILIIFGFGFIIINNLITRSKLKK